MKGGKSIPIPSYSPVFGSNSDLVFHISKIGIFLSFTWEMLLNFEGQNQLESLSVTDMLWRSMFIFLDKTLRLWMKIKKKHTPQHPGENCQFSPPSHDQCI